MSLLGTTIGRIRIVDRLGKGGMGEVYAGFDDTLDRRVAVKCVKSDRRFDDQAKHRFLQEARILSRLAHPNICQIYDFVEERDRDFLVMERVDGKSLHQALEDDLDRHAKLVIAQKVADVLVAAHAEGVVHRDLKPEHVMITEDGDVKVLDFGVAHSIASEPGRSHTTEETVNLSSGEPLTSPQPSPYEELGDLAPGPSLSDSGSVVGTPRYMSPEQARGWPVTPASDMYTFGLLLQELFTGEPPYDRQPLPSLLAAVAEGRSKPAQGIGRSLVDLVEDLKALKPGERPTAREAARRLRAIRDAPRRRRNRLVALTATALVLAGAVKYTVDLRRERSTAVTARNQAIAARDQAEGLVTFMLDDLAEALRPVGKLEVLDKVAHKALDYYEQAPESAGEAAYRRGQAFYRVAEVLESQGDLAAALDAAAAARDLHQRQVGLGPERTEWQNGLALDYLLLSEIYRQLGDRDRAREAVRAGREIGVRLVELEPDRPEWVQTLAESHYATGVVELFMEPEAAREAFLRSIELYQSLSVRDPGKPYYRYRLAVLYGQGLGQVYKIQGREADSLAAVERAFDLYLQVTREDPSNSRWQNGFAWENRRLGEHYGRQGRWDDALAAYRRARAISERLLALEPSQVDWQTGLGMDHALIAGALEGQGRLGEALEAYGRALAVFRRLAEIDPEQRDYPTYLAENQLSAGRVLAGLGRDREAREAREQVVELLSPIPPGELDGYALEVQALALLHLARDAEAALVVERLQAMRWFEGAPRGDLVELSRDRGWIRP